MNNIKLAIIVGLSILIVWGLYITLIYMNSIPQSMEKETFCKIVIVAATQKIVVYLNITWYLWICRKISAQEITTFS